MSISFTKKINPEKKIIQKYFKQERDHTYNEAAK